METIRVGVSSLYLVGIVAYNPIDEEHPVEKKIQTRLNISVVLSDPLSHPSTAPHQPYSPADPGAQYKWHMSTMFGPVTPTKFA